MTSRTVCILRRAAIATYVVLQVAAWIVAVALALFLLVVILFSTPGGVLT